MAQTATISKIGKFPKTVVQFVKEAYVEIKKVTWPTRDTTVRYTIIVIIASLSIGAIIGGIDYILSTFMERFVI